jgi:hypothetical protein
VQSYVTILSFVFTLEVEAPELRIAVTWMALDGIKDRTRDLVNTPTVSEAQSVDVSDSPPVHGLLYNSSWTDRVRTRHTTFDTAAST